MDFGTTFAIAATVVFVTMLFMMRAPKSAPAAINLKPLPADFESQVRPLLNAGKRIEALNLVRQYTSLGLREANDLVGAMANGATANQVLAQFTNLPTQLKPELIQQVDQLIANGKLIDALKFVRETSGLGMKQSKEVVDKLVATRQFRILQNIMGQDLGVAIPNYVPNDDDDDAAIKRLITHDKKIEALKLYRERHDCGLKEAKDAIDRLAVEMKNPLVRLDPLNQADFDETVRDLIRREKKIEALKLYREQHDCGLKEAKEAIDRLSDEMRSPILRLDPGQQADASESVRELLRSNQKIEALKLYREQHGCGLKEAKEAIDRLCKEMGC